LAYSSFQENEMPKLRCLGTTLFLLCFILSVASAQDTKPVAPIPAHYAAAVVGQAGGAAGKTFGLTVYVDGLTSDGEVQELLGILKQKGQNGVVGAMEDMLPPATSAPACVSSVYARTNKAVSTSSW
jgi:hypothetical protein